jgi:hypothetical protein
VPVATLAQQETPAETLRGMVWTPPAERSAAIADLRAMREAGVEALRIPLIDDGPLLRTTDLEQMALYVDLPVENLPAARLRDTLAFASRQMDALLALARQHPSIRGVGLAASSDTSVPAACGYFATLAEAAREAGLVAYYRTRFIESDVCADQVDAVLLDARGRDPVALLSRWRRHHETPAGIGSLGAEVRTGRPGGYLTRGTEAYQARTLEDDLRRLIRMEEPPAGLFVHRWRGGAYGLHDEDGTARRAAEVVRGFFTGRQMVFAVDAGAEPAAPPGAVAFTVIGWLVAIFLVLLLTLAPRFRGLIPQYFMRHGYYRESLQRSAGLEGFAAAAVAIAVAVSAGLLNGVMVHAVAQTDILEVAAKGVTEGRLETIQAALRQPVFVALLGTLVYGLWILINMVWLLALAGKRHRIRPMQAGVLAAFSRWPLMVLAILALLAAHGGDVLRWIPALLGLWAAIEFVAAARMLYDYGRVSRVPMPRAILAGMGVPLLILAGIAAVLFATAGPDLTFMWHLATRT